MENYLLLSDPRRVNLLGVAKMVANQRGAKLFVYNDASQFPYQCDEPGLMVVHRVLGKQLIEGETEIINYLREMQHKNVY